MPPPFACGRDLPFNPVLQLKQNVIHFKAEMCCHYPCPLQAITVHAGIYSRQHWPPHYVIGPLVEPNPWTSCSIILLPHPATKSSHGVYTCFEALRLGCGICLALWRKELVLSSPLAYLLGPWSFLPDKLLACSELHHLCQDRRVIGRQIKATCIRVFPFIIFSTFIQRQQFVEESPFTCRSSSHRMPKAKTSTLNPSSSSVSSKSSVGRTRSMRSRVSTSQKVRKMRESGKGILGTAMCCEGKTASCQHYIL